MRRNIAVTYRAMQSEWEGNYRYHGGIRALERCVLGTVAIKVGAATCKPEHDGEVDCITFSVVPTMTALWSRFIKAAISTPTNVIVGDCSGGYPRGRCGERADTVLPVLNYDHGKKLDLFMERVCRAEYVLASDDDIFFMDEVPWNWAIEQLESNPNAAVVSLHPRIQVSSVMREAVSQPMGSHCLVVRRDIWLAEKLSFRADRSPLSQGYDWPYDTADLANVELLRRGYDIVIAPPDICAHLTAFEGVSTWTLKIQKHRGDILESVQGVSLRQEKALATVLFARGVSQIIAEEFPGEPNPHLIAPALLDRAEAVCKSLLGQDAIRKVTSDVEQSLQHIRNRLSAMTAQV
jgi:hypothetical protein